MLKGEEFTPHGPGCPFTEYQFMNRRPNSPYATDAQRFSRSAPETGFLFSPFHDAVYCDSTNRNDQQNQGDNMQELPFERASHPKTPSPSSPIERLSILAIKNKTTTVLSVISNDFDLKFWPVSILNMGFL
jgi:hypothetical protein